MSGFCQHQSLPGFRIHLLFIRSEFSYDEFDVNAYRIFRVDWEILFGGTHTCRAAVTPPMAETLVRNYPEVEAATGSGTGAPFAQ